MHYKHIIPLLFLLILSSCNDKPREDETQPTTEKEKIVQLKGDNIILAVVNGSVISRYDLDLAIQKLVGAEAAARMDTTASRKVLESMVISRAIGQARDKEMSKLEHAEIIKEVAVYREQFLVRRYLANHGSPNPVTMEQIQDYYDAHLEFFGAKTTKQYEMITTKRPLNAGERDEVLGKFGKLEKHENWRGWADDMETKGYPIAYRQGKGHSEVLHPQLSQALGALSKGEVSQLILVSDTPYFLRIVAEQQVPGQPISEVTGIIKKALVSKQVKQVIEKVGQKVLANAEVEYK